MQAMVVYSSVTGNTQRIATAIFTAIPGDSKDMQRISEYQGKDAETYFVGFWTDKGSCSPEIGGLLSGLHNKRVALFGTCGMGKSDAYYAQVEEEVKRWLPRDNEYMGAFLCQGKMPMAVRKRFEAMLAAGENTELIQKMIRNFDEALLHPDRDDEREAMDFARRVMER